MENAVNIGGRLSRVRMGIGVDVENLLFDDDPRGESGKTPYRVGLVMAGNKSLDEQFRMATRRAGKKRTSEDRRVVMPAGAPPGRGLVPGLHTGVLECRDEDGTAGYFLVERRLRVGTAFEMYTNAGNGWIRGRFEWDGGFDDPPRLVMNIWNPKGPWDEDGLPPWIGSAEIKVPSTAICRFPKG